MLVLKTLSRWWFMLIAVGALAACERRQGKEGEVGFTLQGIRCGSERWPVKTGTDFDVLSVNMEPADATIGDLISVVAPSFLPRSNRVGDPEFQVWRLTDITLNVYKLETDNDYHLVLVDQSQTMIAEIPHPECVGAGSPFIDQIQSARTDFDANFAATPFFQTADVTASFVGVGFFDFLHGQRGVAPNGIELHPVLGFCLGPGCALSGGKPSTNNR